MSSNENILSPSTSTSVPINALREPIPVRQPPTFISTITIQPQTYPQMSTRYPPRPEEYLGVSEDGTTSRIRRAENRSHQGISQWRRTDTQNQANPNLLPDVRYVPPFSLRSYNMPRYEAVVDLARMLNSQNSKGLSESQLQKLTTTLYESDCPTEQLSCVVCMSEFEHKETLRVLPCDHMFHTRCVDEWLKFKDTCPICRYDLNHIFKKEEE